MTVLDLSKLPLDKLRGTVWFATPSLFIPTIYFLIPKDTQRIGFESWSQNSLYLIIEPAVSLVAMESKGKNHLRYNKGSLVIAQTLEVQPSSVSKFQFLCTQRTNDVYYYV